MKIAFFGLKTAFDYFQIGGTESFVRRLATQMVQEGYRVDYVFYGDKKGHRDLSPAPGLTLKYFESIEVALDVIKQEKYEHVVTIYLLPKDRVKYGLFRRENSSSIIFHFIYFGWPDSLIKRRIYFCEARLFPYNGRLFCISQRQQEYVKKWANNAVHIFPPVPETYFLCPEDKPLSAKTKITYLGRVDRGKGIVEVIDIFNRLKGNDKFECYIYGIHIAEDKQSLAIHDLLRKQKDIKYIEVDRQKYSTKTEYFVGQVLKETDILIQPYQKLSSTIDTPLLLLEAMANLCAVIAPPLGDLHETYGVSNFNPRDGWSTSAVTDLIEKSQCWLATERERLVRQNASLKFSTKSVTEKFGRLILGGT